MKPWYQSKTLIVNVIMFVVAVLEVQEVIDIVPPAWGGALAAIVAIANIGLRTITTQPLTFTEPPKQRKPRKNHVGATNLDDMKAPKNTP